MQSRRQGSPLPPAPSLQLKLHTGRGRLTFCIFPSPTFQKLYSAQAWLKGWNSPFSPSSGSWDGWFPPGAEDENAGGLSPPFQLAWRVEVPCQEGKTKGIRGCRLIPWPLTEQGCHSGKNKSLSLVLLQWHRVSAQTKPGQEDWRIP